MMNSRPHEQKLDCRGGDGECVLLVDDDPVARLLTASALAERNWRVLEAESAAQALALFAASHPDVVVLDALMPGVDGFETCRRLRVLPAGEHVPVLMLTGLDDELSITRAYEAGATDFFVKTSSQWTLLSERLRYMLRAARTREALAASQRILNKAQRIARIGSWEWDIARRWVRVSDEFYAIAGLPKQAEGLADWFLWSRVAEEDRPRLQQLLEQAKYQVGQLHFECRLLRSNGQSRTVRVEAEVDRNDDGRPITVHGVVHDVTERKQAEDQIRRLANFDSLTGLPNRRFFRDQFNESLARAAANGTQVAVLFIDVDRFKQINDTLGHDVGDQLLRELAVRLYAAVRDTDTVARVDAVADDPLEAQSHFGCSVARLGGDEFTVLLTDLADTGVAERVAQRLLEALRQPVTCAGHEVFATVSIGLAVFPHDGTDVDTLVRKADIAMYAVKETGRNGWRLYDGSMHTVSADRWRLEVGLHHALARNELVLHFQPKIDVVAGRVIGAEALMRWQREGELVPPGEFISVAEDTGLIVPITEWAINEVCRQMLAWRAAGVAPVPVSVNISSRHVQRADLSAPVRAALTATGLDPGLLELELTETVLMQNIDSAGPLLLALKQLGVALSIDDFGTGYSSLSYLKRLPIDTLKIDRSFVRDLETASDNAAIVAAIIAMSRSLRLRVVAEGVETVGQMRRLAEQGCVLQQGWLFAKALPAQEFVDYLRQAADGIPGLESATENFSL
jgi:PAS domain S-box-containing protein